MARIIMKKSHPFDPKNILLIATLTITNTYAENLTEIYSQARQEDPTLNIMAAKKNVIIENNNIQRAELFPQINWQGNYGRQRITTETSKIGFDDVKGFTLSLSMPLYRHELWIALQEAKLQTQQTNLEYAASEQNLILRVAENYFEILAAQDNLKYTNQEKTALEHQLAKKKAELHVGLTTITEVHEAQARYDLINADTIAAQNRLDNAHTALATITNKTYKMLAKLNTDIPKNIPEPNDPNQWAEQTKTNNLTLKANRLNVAIAKKQIQEQRANHLPTLDMIGERRYSKSPNLFGVARSDQELLQVQLNVPLFKGGKTLSQVRQAKHTLIQTQYELIKTERETEQQTRNTYLKLTNDIQQIKALEQAVTSNQKALEANELSLAIGTRNLQDVLTAQSNTYQAQKNLAQARYDYILNSLRLKQLVGQLSPQDLTKINHWLTE